MDRRSFIGWSLVQGAAAAFPGRILAAQPGLTLRMGVQAAPSSLDPHFQDIYTSTQALLQIYSPLLSQDSTGAVVPGIAQAWKPVDDTTWEVTLRKGVRFHDGTPFEAEDIIFSFNRVPNVVGAIGPFTANVRDITKISIVSPEVVRFTLKAPDPLFYYKLTQVCMLSRKIHAKATLGDFNSGKLAIGTGPYRYVSYSLGDRMELAAYKDFWGGKPAWDRVSIKYITDPGARIAALNAGEVDLIDNIPVQDVASFRTSNKFAVFSSHAFLSIYLFPDSSRDQTPFVFDNAGKALAHNPLKDPRVRRALSMSIDRQGIVDRLMAGQGDVADQISSLADTDRAPDMPKLVTDLKAAKELLKQAGYPDGFRLTVHGPSGWFGNDSNVVQAIAQGFTRIGVKTSVEVLPVSTLLARARKQATSMFMGGFNSPFALVSLRFQAMTPDPATGNGTSNYQKYSNPELDQLMRKALVEMDTAKRNALVWSAMRELTSDMGLIPVFYTRGTWAGRKGFVDYHADPMSRTSAFYADPAKGKAAG